MDKGQVAILKPDIQAPNKRKHIHKNKVSDAGSRPDAPPPYNPHNVSEPSTVPKYNPSMLRQIDKPPQIY